MHHKVFIVGNLGAHPELRFVGSDDTPVCNFSVATNRRQGDKDITTWFRITAWRRLAEIAKEYLEKGKPVIIEGYLTPDPDTGGPKMFDRNDGTVGAAYEITATEMRFVNAPTAGDAGKASKASEEEEEEIPF